MRTDSRQSPSKRTARSGRLGIIAAAAALLAAGGWAAVREQHANPDAAAAVPSAESLLGDFNAVWSWSEQAFIGGAGSAKWAIRWDEDGAWKAEDARKLAERLGIALTKQSGNQLTGSDSGHIVYAGEKKTADGIELTLWLRSGEGDASSVTDAVVLLQPPAGTGDAPIRQTAQSVVAAAHETGLLLKGSFAARGRPAGKEAATRLAAAADAEQREAYDDGHTRSVTYYSPKLRTGLTSAGKRINLQIAQAGGQGGDVAELIVGVPLITGDYSVQN